MRELQGMSYADMAKAMDCSKGTIMSRLFHARRNMQKLLRDRLDHLDPEVAESEQSSDTSTSSGSLTQEAAS
jgi:RNA polymerase sigma-70 factor (ECF subfamily)